MTATGIYVLAVLLVTTAVLWALPDVLLHFRAVGSCPAWRIGWRTLPDRKVVAWCYDTGSRVVRDDFEVAIDDLATGLRGYLTYHETALMAGFAIGILRSVLPAWRWAWAFDWGLFGARGRGYLPFYDLWLQTPIPSVRPFPPDDDPVVSHRPPGVPRQSTSELSQAILPVWMRHVLTEIRPASWIVPLHGRNNLK